MKILVVSDIHYSLQQFDWLLRAAPYYDVVIVAGDLLDTNSLVDLGTQVVVVLNYLKRIKPLTTLLVCSGNHDLDEPNADGEMHPGWLRGVRDLGIPTDGDSVMLGDTLMTICGWWDGAATMEEIGIQLAAAAGERQGPWYWIYHAPPPQSAVSWAGGRHFGDQALLGWIAQHGPDVVISGHVHEAPFVRNGSWVDRMGETWLFNAGKQIGPVPTTIAIDTEAGEAAWFSVEGAEAVKLGAKLLRPLPALTAMPEWMPAPR